MFPQGHKGLQNFCGIIGINLRKYLYPCMFQEHNPHVRNKGAELFFQTNLTLSFTRRSPDRSYRHEFSAPQRSSRCCNLYFIF
jgi:hypothetical protein